MPLKYKLKAEELTSNYNLDDLPFETTEDIQPLEGIIGQKRGVEALKFGLKMDRKGYNLYVAGVGGTGRSSFTNSIVELFAKEKPVPKDWIYVYNFKKKEAPNAINLKPGRGMEFKKEFEDTIDSLKKVILETFSGMEYETRKGDIYKIYNQKKNENLKKLNEKSSPYGFIYTPTEQGLLSVPMKDGKPINEAEYQELSLENHEDMMLKYNELRVVIVEELNNFRNLDVELINNIRDLDKKIASDIVRFDIGKISDQFAGNLGIKEYLKEVEEDIMANIEKFKEPVTPPKMTNIFDFQPNTNGDFFIRYKVNLFIDNSNLEHAPIIKESNPIYYNLMGSIEYKNQMGTLTTDFMQIKPGSLHLANGGYLIFQMKEILNNPISWEMLKRSLKTEEINIENQNKLMGMAVTSSLKPESIPLDIKIIIIGDEQTYNYLYQIDEDFIKLFKVKVDFDIEMKKTKENILLMSQFIANQSRDCKLKPFSKEAIGRIVEYASRLADHQDKISTRFNKIVEIVFEADLWAQEDGSRIVTDIHIKKAIDEKRYRSNRYEEKLNEIYLDGTILIDVDGEKVGQINGLAVVGMGEYSFGKPSRITASVYMGEKGVISIEREAGQSGNIYDKGVLILSGYLGQKYARNKPLGLNIGIGFEQNYSMIEGDSASSTELYAILSSLANVPIKQYIAVTGSINQKGEVQPIGGVNEKIEGFYHICKLKGLTGKQGVMIPRTNMKNLVLKEGVINSVKNGEFHIYAIDHVDQGIKILTDLDAGELDDLGEYPEASINYLIMENLKNRNRLRLKLV